MLSKYAVHVKHIMTSAKWVHYVVLTRDLEVKDVSGRSKMASVSKTACK